MAGPGLSTLLGMVMVQMKLADGSVVQVPSPRVPPAPSIGAARREQSARQATRRHRVAGLNPISAFTLEVGSLRRTHLNQPWTHHGWLSQCSWPVRSRNHDPWRRQHG